MRVVRNREKIFSFRMRYLAHLGKFCGKSSAPVKVLGLYKIFIKFDENHRKSMKFGIEDRNLHSFRQGIRFSNRCKPGPHEKNINLIQNLTFFLVKEFSSVYGATQNDSESSLHARKTRFGLWRLRISSRLEE